MSIMLAAKASQVAHNLFFAVKPAEAERGRIGDLIGALRIGGVPMRLDRLHITILSLIVDDVLPPGLAEQAVEMAASLRMPPFRVFFDRLVGGRRSAMLRPSEPIEALRLFRERLGFALMGAGIGFRQDGRFSPHVTLLYGGQPNAEMEIEQIGWTVEDFVLIDSFIGQTKHVEVGRWPLRA